jgi:branched-chain amino acid aminotransferase
VSELAQADAVPVGPGFDRGAAYVRGQFVPIDEATVPVLDVGFSRSDVTYDVVAVWEGAFFRLHDHLERFERSCRELRLTLEHDRDGIASILIELVRLTGLRAAYVETLCTRGVDRAGVRDPRTFENQFIAYAIPYVWLLRPDDGTAGMDAVITRSVRRIPPASVDPTVKNFHWGDLTRPAGSTRPTTEGRATRSSWTSRGTLPRAPATTWSPSSAAGS